MRSEYTILIFNFSKFSGETPSEEVIKMEFKTTFINFTIVFMCDYVVVLMSCMTQR